MSDPNVLRASTSSRPRAASLSTSWRDDVAALRDAGFTWFEWLDCVDEIGRSDELRVVLRAVDRSTGEARQVETRTPRDSPEVASIADLYAGAAWAERELHDLFGVVFTGGDDRPLLIPRRFGAHPLRKDEVLGARAAVGWPGAKEPGESGATAGRRRMVPPGVPDSAVWGDRDPEAGPADPAEVAASAIGGRVRRRTR
ncbi:NADH-quinone oxidoreductase subunit C [Mariniluteicoccus flavus]